MFKETFTSKIDKDASPFRRQMRYFFLRFIRLKGDPSSLARGVAVGLFIGVTPTIPLHTILTLALALVCRGSKIAALLSSWLISNPLTFFPQYYFSWKIGSLVTSMDLSWDRIEGEIDLIRSGAGFWDTLASFGQLGQEAIIGMLAGGCLLATPITIIGFFASRYFFAIIQKKRQQRHTLN